MNNYYRTIIKNIHRIIYYIIKVRIWMRHPERHSEADRYAVANAMVTKMNRSSGYSTMAFGLDKLPKDGGYVMYPNHQGKYDVLGIFTTHEKPCSFVMDEKKSHMILVAEFLWLVRGKAIIMNDLRQTLNTFNEMAKEIVNEGRKYILFPEGGYKENNRNVVEAFKPGSFKLAKMAKAPIVPVALVDSYKVYNSPHKGPVTTYVYYLDPIYYDDYKDKKTVEIAGIVETRIKEKIAEHLRKGA